ncbi:CHASE domain-containing protein [Methylomonas sp. HW2-6]|uniref:CHASE domain-containing protein n=1 Tax=Methylomonas sp. HW2-6 TaxID=3376687 RepID=UPI004042E6A5
MLYAVAFGIVIIFLASIGFNLHLRQQQSLDKALREDSQRISTKINERLNAYAQLLKAGAGLFAASNTVERAEWKNFVEKLDLDQTYRGIQGVGFSELISRADLPAHIAQIRNQGFPEYVVNPPGDREQYSSIIFLEPFSGRNLRAFGYDMLSEPTRNEAMLRARDIGDIAFSGKVKLVQETKTDVQAGVLAYLPVFKNGAITQTLDQRRASLIGWVYSPYRMNDLIKPIVEGELSALDLQIFDGEKTTENSLFNSAPDMTADGYTAANPLLTHDVNLEVGGHTWILHFTALPGYATINHVAKPWPEYFGLVSIAFLTLGLFWLSANTRIRAHKIARNLTDDLREQTERLKANQLLLKESESRFQSVSNAAPVLIWVAGADGRCNWFNKVWLDFTGRTMEQELGQGWTAGVHPDDIDRCLEIYTGHFDRRTSFHMEYRLRRHDGEYRWLQDNGVPRFDALGNFLGYIGSCFDMTENILALDKARESEERWQFALEGAGDGVWDWNIGAGLIVYSKRWYEIQGFEEGSMKADIDTWRQLVHPNDLAIAEAALQTHFRGESPNFSCEHRVICGDGHYKWILGRGMVVSRDAQGNPLRVIGTHTDITERKQQEQELKQLLRIINESPDYIGTADMSGNLLFHNLMARRMVGLDDNADLSNRKIQDMHPEWAAQKILEEGVPAVLKHGYWKNETAILNQDGREIPVSQILLLHRDEAGNPQMLSTIMRDITEQKQYLVSLEDAKQVAEGLAKTKSEFLANMSHEIRTPMNGIIGLSKLALDKELPVEVRDYLEKINASSESLLGILNDILDFSKLEAGKLTIDQQHFNLKTLLDNLYSLFSHRAAEKALALTIDIAEDTPADLIGDALRLQQILANLIGNAIKFTERGRIGIHIKPLAQEGSSARLSFAVADSGIGITEEDQSRLFQPFSQVDGSATRRFGGTGLGLAITKQLLELMGSQLKIDSTPGQGSTFHFVLPTVLASAPSPHVIDRRSERRSAGALSQDLRQKGLALAGTRVLVAEDNKINQKVVTEFLKLANVEVVIANNGAEALEWLERQEFDAILMDVHMPGMGGAEATGRIRANPKHVELPIIALTAGVTETERENCLQIGMTDFLPKPLDPEQMIAVLSRWIRRPNQPQRSSAVGQIPENAGTDAAKPLSPDTTTAFSIPTPEAEWPSIPGIDSARSQLNLFGDRELFIELLALYAGENNEVIAGLKRHFANRDWTEARQVAHRLKGQIANLGASDAVAKAAALEAALKANSPGTEEAYAQLIAENDRLLAAITGWLKTNARIQAGNHAN